MKRSFILILITLLTWSFTQAQIQDTCRISSLDGLPDDNVNCIFKDHRGLMWFATDKGVTCYNGASIVNVEWEDKQFRRVVDIKEDVQGRIFVATNDGIFKVEMNDFILKLIYPDCTEINSLLITTDGTLYACSNHGLYKCNEQNSPLLITFEDNVMSEENATTNICASTENDKLLWVCSNRKLYSIDTITGKRHCYDLTHLIGASSRMTTIASYKNNLYIGTKDRGVLRFCTKEKKAQFYPLLPEGDVRDLNVDAQGHLNVSMYNFYEVDIDKNSIVRTTKSHSAYTSLHDTDLGVTWFGHYLEGLAYNYHKRQLVSHFTYKNFDSCTLFVRSLCKHGNDILIGTREGFYHINSLTETCRYFAPKEIGANIVTDIVWFAGRFVLATWEFGIRTYDPLTHTVSLPEAFNEQDETFHFDMGDFSSLTVSQDKKTLVAVGNQGCFFFDQEMRCQHNYNSKNSKLHNEYITSAFFDNQGILWIGSMKRLYMFDLQNRTFISRFPKPFFDNTQYLAFSQDTDGDVLAFGEGKIFKCKSDLSSYTTFDLSLSPGCGNIYFVHPHKGQYLVGTSLGLFLFDKDFKQYKQYSFSDNLPTLAFNKSEIQQMEDGSLWMATNKGIISLSSLQLDKLNDSVKGKVILDKLWISNKVVSPNTLYSMIDNPEISISWTFGSEDISFVPLLLDYSLNIAKLYEYKIDNGDFSASRDRETVNIGSLSLGTHTITIRLAGHPETTTRYTVTVLPSALFFFEIIFFILLCVSIFVGIDMRKRWKKRKQKLLLKHKLEREISAQNAIVDMKRQQLAEQEAQEHALEEARRQRTSTREFKELQAKMKQYMELERPYRNPNFRLSDLAKAVDSTPAAISLMLNESLKTNFYDYINRYRLEDFKHKYKSPTNQNLSTSALYEKCGFKKTTFFAAFKKFEGCTPLEWMKKNDCERTSQP
ncbi:MAG: helix-turn-helix domain-containing protein [Bacteroidaceae bacterium]|nr:helix-turn-helix domain-containing protein [Bacteroidaceae bacterium]